MVDLHVVDMAVLTRALRRHWRRDAMVTAVTALSAGAASDTFAVEVTLNEELRPLIFQRSPNGGPVEGALPKSVQAKLQRRVHEQGLPVAEVVCILEPDDGLGQGFLMQRVAGESLAPRYLRDDSFAPARAVMTQQCGAFLAQLHALPVTVFDGLPLAQATTVEQVNRLESMYRGFDVDLPVFELTFSWLRRHLPVTVARALVHGDFRSGNFLVQPADGIVAVLDWELAHIGDPLEDIGWLCVNSWRFGNWRHAVGGFGDREELYAAYEAAGGTLDRKAMWFWEIYGTLRWGLSCLQLAHQHLSGSVVSVERAAIGRRVSETEIDLLHLIDRGTI